MAHYVDATGTVVSAAEWQVGDEGGDFLPLVDRCAGAKALGGPGSSIIVGGRSTDGPDEMTGRREIFAVGDWLIVNDDTGGWDRVEASAFNAHYTPAP